ncbi:metal-dependent hydrolase family protein [Sneathiella chinensis]|uniref:Peptidase M38 n=1 Tax=Sneathiella chinensis TaxID=349750 RepID=A0ABQ5U2C5_9PROT|nr:amidohydrolase family protein [Sneathiella chinensis]GLQ05893.1 peptidase M38 [Sneathiella chinensis]
MPTTTITINNANLLDVRTGNLRGARNLFIEDGVIREISASPVAVGDERLDLDGMVLMPGLCDAHVHVVAATANFNSLMRWSPSYVAARSGQILSGMLSRGFTTVRDCGGADYGLVQSIEEGYLIGPRVLFAGHAISQTGGHGDMREKGEHWESCTCCAGLGRIADGVPEVRRACREELRKGANFIKIMASGGVSSPTDRIGNTQFSIDEITAAVEEAEAAQTYVAAHVYTARAANRALRCGVRSIEHGNLIDDETIDLMLEKNAFLVPTMSTHEALKVEGREGGLTDDMYEKVDQVVEAGYRTHAHAHSRGVRMVFGTDLLGPMHRHQLTEFKIRSRFQTPAELIRSATLTAAELFQMEGEIGELAPGARADMIALSGDPLADIGVLQDPDRYLKMVMKGGQIFKNAL